MKTTILPFVRYHNVLEHTSGHGVQLQEDTEHVYIASEISIALLASDVTKDVQKVPTFAISKWNCTREYSDTPATLVPEWIRSFPIASLTENQIHHVALFFEHIIHDSSLSLAKRIEQACQYSLLETSLLQETIRFTISHQAKTEDITSLLLSPSVKKYLD